MPHWREVINNIESRNSVNEPLPIEEALDQEQQLQQHIHEPFYKKYKIHLSVAAALIVVGVSAFAHYKNERVKEELMKSLDEYAQNLTLMGGEMKYGSVDCNGILSSDCEIEKISFSMLGQEQLSLQSLRLGDVESLAKFKTFGEGESIDASIDIEAKGLALPKPIIAQLIASNVSNAFQQNTIAKLSTIDVSLKGEVEGNAMHLKHLTIDSLRLDNAIMPIEFSMSAREVSSQAPDSMVLEQFALSAENRSIFDVTYESVKSFVSTLSAADQEVFLKEFSLRPADMNDRAKASKVINETMAKRFEADLPNTPGVVEKELIRAMAKMLKGEAESITLEGKNQNDLTMVQIQNALQQSATMSEEEAKKFMNDKFRIEVETH